MENTVGNRLLGQILPDAALTTAGVKEDAGRGRGRTRHGSLRV